MKHVHGARNFKLYADLRKSLKYTCGDFIKFQRYNTRHCVLKPSKWQSILPSLTKSHLNNKFKTISEKCQFYKFKSPLSQIVLFYFYRISYEGLQDKQWAQPLKSYSYLGICCGHSSTFISLKRQCKGYRLMKMKNISNALTCNLLDNNINCKTPYNNNNSNNNNNNNNNNNQFNYSFCSLTAKLQE